MDMKRRQTAMCLGAEVRSWWWTVRWKGGRMRNQELRACVWVVVQFARIGPTREVAVLRRGGSS